MSLLKRGIRTGLRYMIMAFLVVIITQVLLYFGLIGLSFVEQLIITFISLIIAAILIAIVFQPK